MLSEMLRCEDVTFAYGKRPVLEEFSFSAGRGVIGLLGPNGAGKSTLLSILATIRSPKAGRVIYEGTPVDGNLCQVRRRLGYLPQLFDLMAGSTCQANVSYAAWCNGVAARDCDEAARSALATVNLGAKARHRVRTLSGGQRQRLGIACAIAHSPSVILLDEPTVGLDPAQRIDVRRHLVDIGRNACVLVSTHLVEDLMAMHAQTIVINHGRKMFQGTLEQMAHSAEYVDAHTVETAYLNIVGSEE